MLHKDFPLLLYSEIKKFWKPLIKTVGAAMFIIKHTLKFFNMGFQIKSFLNVYDFLKVDSNL